MATAPDAWTEFALIGILDKAGSEIQFAGFTEDITGLDFGDKDVEGMPLVNGGRVVKRIPMADESVTLKVYPISALRDGTGVVQDFHPPATDDSTQPILVDNSNTRDQYRVVMLWTTMLPAGLAAASTAPDQGEAAYRITAINAYMTSYKPSFDDKMMSAEITFKWAPFQKDGTRNKLEESTSGSTVLPDVITFA